MSRQSKGRVLLTTVAQSEASPRNAQVPPATGLAKLYRQILFSPTHLPHQRVVTDEPLFGRPLKWD